MAITEIRIGATRSVNLGNYENAKLEAGLTIAINEGDDVEAVKASLRPELRGLLETAWKALTRPAQTAPKPGTPQTGGPKA